MNIVSAGIQMGNTTVTTYVVDCYPQHAMAVITFYSVLLNLSAFVDPVGTLILRPFFHLSFFHFFFIFFFKKKKGKKLSDRP